MGAEVEPVAELGEVARERAGGNVLHQLGAGSRPVASPQLVLAFLVVRSEVDPLPEAPDLIRRRAVLARDQVRDHLRSPAGAVRPPQLAPVLVVFRAEVKALPEPREPDRPVAVVVLLDALDQLGALFRAVGPPQQRVGDPVVGPEVDELAEAGEVLRLRPPRARI